MPTQEVTPMTMPEASELLSREERFMATIATINTLLIQKLVYRQQEFDALFIQWARVQQNKPKSERPGWQEYMPEK